MAGNNGNGTGVRLRAARPAISIADSDNPTLAQGLLSLLISESTSGLFRCEAVFGNWGAKNNKIDFLYFDRRTLDFGKNFKVKLGTDTLFDGRIMALEAQFPEGQAPTLMVLAEDRFQDLRMTRRTRTFTDVSDADLINQIANAHGLSPSVDVTGPTHKVLAQVNLSDLAFLRERARAIDAELWMTGSTLNVKGHVQRNGATVRLTYGNELRSFSVVADLAHQRSSVAVNGWDVADKAGLHYAATDAVINGELNGDVSGASILATALGQRKEALAHTMPLTSQEAQTAAESFFKMNARRFVTGRGVAETDSQLCAGNYANLQGLGPLFNGKYYLCEVHHLFDGAQGLRTEFTAERPGLGRN